MPEQKITVNRMLHYVMPDGQCRPCVVVRVWPGEFDGGKEDGYNIQVFTDGYNDQSQYFPDAANGIVWRTSVRYDPEKVPNTIHWPEMA